MKQLVFFSGAGMSAESGISTFRDSNGLWENYDVAEVATPEAWLKNPRLVQEFYNARRKNVMDASPNDAHKKIAELEEKYLVTVITQNIDDLHERAGSSHVMHLHGNIRLAKSSGPNSEKKFYPIAGDSLSLETDFCDDGYPLRPHVVWFGENVPMYEKVIPIIESADIFVVIGTSLNVYPAAGLIHYCNPKAIKFLIDPKANELAVPPNFHVIRKTAIDGLKEVMLYLV
jgi:NAD-dependent deacetylase